MLVLKYVLQIVLYVIIKVYVYHVLEGTFYLQEPVLHVYLAVRNVIQAHLVIPAQ